MSHEIQSPLRDHMIAHFLFYDDSTIQNYRDRFAGRRGFAARVVVASSSLKWSKDLRRIGMAEPFGLRFVVRRGSLK
jgi:hypothetical protein